MQSSDKMYCIACGHDAIDHYYTNTGPAFQKCRKCSCERNLITGAWID